MYSGPGGEWEKVRPKGCTCHSYYRRACCENNCDPAPIPEPGYLKRLWAVFSLYVIYGKGR